MIKVENIEVFNMAGAVRAMRNPYDSWAKSDSQWMILDNFDKKFIVGNKDYDLMVKLLKAGPEHRKFMRQIFVSMDIVAPLFWFKEMDTYKVGTVANSCSTMHTIHKKPFRLADFSCEHLTSFSQDVLEDVIEALNTYREQYINYDASDDDDDKLSKEVIWRQMIELLPSSYNQRRTITMNYENVWNIISQRRHHKLIEWREFCTYLIEELPLMELFEDER